MKRPTWLAHGEPRSIAGKGGGVVSPRGVRGAKYGGGTGLDNGHGHGHEGNWGTWMRFVVAFIEKRELGPAMCRFSASADGSSSVRGTTEQIL